MKILVLNSGSSSLKFQLFNVEGENYNPIVSGLADRIGIDGSLIKLKANGEKVTKELELPSHNEAISNVFDLLLNEVKVIDSLEELTAVGHRIVHGGEDFTKSALVTPDVIKAIENNSKLAPLHNPANLLGIKAISDLLPNIPQTVVFDTAFHQTMDKKSYLYALPMEQYTEHKIRKYGFHGTSHYYVSSEAEKLMGKSGKVITCHLGNGASIAAVDHGKSVDTSMGFTPLAGVVMGTRSGDMDPYIPLHIMKEQNLSVEEVNTILNKQSGVLGLGGKSDMRDVEDGYLAGDASAVMTMEAYIYRIQKYIGAYAAAMNGVDAIVFTAGVGENSPITRELVCKNLSFLGLELNKEANDTRGTVEISSTDSKVKVYTIPTDEEMVIARDTVNLI
jgi:acetate kinase